MNAIVQHSHVWRDFALELEAVGAVLTAASNHPLVIERQGPHGTERGFKLKLHEKNPDAPLSPIFFNLRTPDNPKPGPLTEYHVEMTAHCMRHILPDALEFDAVVGVPRAGDPFAQALARLSGTKCIAMNKWEHDGKRRIASLAGEVPVEVEKVLLVDDLITGADSKREAIEILREQSIEVTDVVVLIDREQGGRNELSEWNCTLNSVYTISQLLDIFVDAGRMSPKLHTDIRMYLAAA